ncbi:DNA polymerase delta subunit 4 isoform X1 [Rhea pennata]|uniref:DNA polymerase delta subunit 4 isoform X1 n=1 Tax=Rhea pennata TaxID=8795 RepID=UPI002E25C07E
MGRKRLITDSFPVLRRRPPGHAEAKGRRGTRREETPAAAAPCPDPAVLDMLRHFDLCWEYGPCTGITRLQRWERAQALGLNPPAYVRDALLKHQDDPAVTYRRSASCQPSSVPRAHRAPRMAAPCLMSQAACQEEEGTWRGLL